MKFATTILLSLCIMAAKPCFSQTILKGILKDQADQPLKSWKVTNQRTGQTVLTKNNGEFSIGAASGDILSFSLLSYMVADYKITDVEITNKLFEYPAVIVQSQKAGAAVTTDSYWLGATIGYNLGGTSSENVVGSAEIMINPMTEKLFGASWGVIGNFSNFQSSQDSSNTNQNIRSVIQSTQGLYLGISSIWDLGTSTLSVAKRIQFTSGAKLNGFSHVGADSGSQTLIQWRNALGFELEGFQFKNGGVMNFSFEGALSLFDKGIYQKVFGRPRSTLLTFDASVIIPVSTNTGILFDGTFAQTSEPVFLIGVIFKPAK